MNGLLRRSKPVLNPRETITGNNSFYSLLSVETCSWTEVWNLPTGKGCLSIWLPFHNPSYIGQFHRFCLQIVWQSSQQRKADGVLGSPEKNFVDNRHADLFSMNGKVELQRTYRTIPLGDLFNSWNGYSDWPFFFLAFSLPMIPSP